MPRQQKKMAVSLLLLPSEKSVLVISYVGFDNQEIVVGSKNAIAVRLVQQAASLTDVVVVGYGKSSGLTLQVPNLLLHQRILKRL
jgi:hypothetical protein